MSNEQTTIVTSSSEPTSSQHPLKRPAEHPEDETPDKKRQKTTPEPSSLHENDNSPSPHDLVESTVESSIKLTWKILTNHVEKKKCKRCAEIVNGWANEGARTAYNKSVAILSYDVSSGSLNAVFSVSWVTWTQMKRTRSMLRASITRRIINALMKTTCPSQQITVGITADTLFAATLGSPLGNSLGSSAVPMSLAEFSLLAKCLVVDSCSEHQHLSTSALSTGKICTIDFYVDPGCLPGAPEPPKRDNSSDDDDDDDVVEVDIKKMGNDAQENKKNNGNNGQGEMVIGSDSDSDDVVSVYEKQVREMVKDGFE